MLFFILFSFIFAQNKYTPEQLDPNNFYCKSNFALKILKLSEEELIFYGTEGGVLRTYDTGETWHQNYTGLNEDDDILKMIFSENKLLGVTYSGKLIRSQDKGDFWEIKKISSNLTGITKIDNDIYSASNIDSVFVSSDNGISWIGYKTPFTNIQNITSQNNKLIAITNDKIYVLNKDFTIFKEINYPFAYKKLYDKFENLYLNDDKKIAMLNNNFEWKIFSIFDKFRDFVIYPIDNNISIITYLNETEKAPIYQQFRYDLNTNSLELISEFGSLFLNNTSDHLDEFKSIDIEYINKEFFLSNYYKTIININTENEWEIISYSCSRSILSNPLSLNEFQMGVLYNTYLLYTKNNGNTFKKSNSPSYQKTMGGRIITYYPRINSAKKIDSTFGFIFFDDYGIKDDKLSTNNHNFFGYTDDDFKTIKPLDIKLLAPYQAIRTPFKVLGQLKNDLYFTRSYKHLNLSIENPYYTYFYKLNTKTLLLDTIHVFKDSLENMNFFIEDNKIWAVGINIINNKSIKLYYSDDYGKSFELKQTFDLIKKHPIFIPYNAYVTKNNNNNLIVNSDFQIEKINEIDYSYTTIELDITLKPWQYEFSEKYFEDIIFSWSEIIDSVQQDNYYMSYISFDKNNKLKFNNIHQGNFNDKGIYMPYFTSEDNQIIIRKGSIEQYYFPIEEDRKAYYSSVVNIQPPSFWTFPPYPNPVKDKLRMRFYSAVMNQLSKLKVELIEIGSGRIYLINEFNIIKTDDYYGEIDIDISNYNSGAYLINFKIGESNKSESIIIE